MKRIVCCCLILCLTIIGLPACAPQEPTADVHAVKLGDTEKQVIEKAGEPDEIVGLEWDTYLYYTSNSPGQYIVLWFQEGKVSIIATAFNDRFVEWKVAETHPFEPLDDPTQLTFWKEGMERCDIIAKLGFEYEEQYSGFGIIIAVYKYKLYNGFSLEVILSAGSINKVVLIDNVGAETTLWQTGVLKKDGTPVL